MKDRISVIFRTAGWVMTLLVLTGANWPSWRGPLQNGVSMETDLISDWTPTGANLVWRADFTGRSTPVVLNGRVYVIGRAGKQVDKQEVVACFDANSGERIWEQRFNVYLTTVPFPRVGWANPATDPESGTIFFHGVGGLFICFDQDGKIIWRHSLTEEFGRISGYGGRTHTPVVDGDLVILSFVSSGWGEQAVPRHRYFAFDKVTGDVVWISTPGGRPYDMNTYSMPVVSEINGRRLLIGGNADGTIQALELHTGSPVWHFSLSKRGINASVVVEKGKVYASHSEENLDEATMGRVVCIDGTGTGDVTETHEIWRGNQLKAGFSSPSIQTGRLYVVGNSANLYCLNAATGERRWEYNLGTVGRGSPVLADGKLYVTETNGHFHILDLGDEEPTSLSKVVLRIDSENRPAEIFSSVAIANRKLYFVSEEGIYCLGNSERPDTIQRPMVSPNEEPEELEIDRAALQIVPADVVLNSQESYRFRAVALVSGARIKEVGSVDPVDEVTKRRLQNKLECAGGGAPRLVTDLVEVSWELAGLSGTIDKDGTFRPAREKKPETGFVRATSGGLEARGRVRVLPTLPWLEDFESVEEGKTPANWIGASTRFAVKSTGDNKVLSKPFVKTGIQRSYVYIGKADMADYTVQADLLGHKSRRRVPDMGLVAQRYALVLLGLRQELQVHSWISELRMAESVPFQWEPEIWYTMKMRVDSKEDKAVVRGKVWPRGEREPEAWTVEVEDPFPNREGTPGLFGQSYAEILYDNIKVTENRK